MSWLSFVTKDDDGNIYEHSINMSEVRRFVHFIDDKGAENVVIIYISRHVLDSGEKTLLTGESAHSAWVAFNTWHSMTQRSLIVQ